MNDLEDRLRRSLHAVAATTPVGPAPSRPGRPLAASPRPAVPYRRRRRLAVATTTALLVPVAGVGAAAAGGALPQPFVDAMGFLRAEGVDPGAAQLVGSLPGPPGKRFEVWRTTGPGTTCLSTWFLPAGTPPGDATPDLDGGASTCRSAQAAAFAEGGTLDSSAGGPVVLKYDAGPAVTATLRLADGTTTTALVRDGLVLGWFPAPAPTDDSPVLTGFDARGAVVGRVALDPPTGSSSR